MVVEGDAGAGKSALLGELRRHGRADGWTLGQIACVEAERGSPYAALDRILRPLDAAQGSPSMEGWSPGVVESGVVDDNTREGYLGVSHTGSADSLRAGQTSAGRIFARQDGRDDSPSLETKDAQYRAVENWGIQDWTTVRRLSDITQPTLVLQGDHDVRIPTKASHLLAALIPGAQLHIFPDASHGSIFLYAEDAAARTVAFLAD